MPRPAPPDLDLEDIVTAVYCALDDALVESGIIAHDGKLVPRKGPPPEVDDREILCLSVLQELIGFESDNEYHQWIEANPTIRQLFPRRLSRPNFADRRVLLTPILARVCGAFSKLDTGRRPPFSLSTPIRSTSAGRSGQARKSGSTDSPDGATAPR